jgi:aspartokinase-like uncharacterized kinase
MRVVKLGGSLLETGQMFDCLKRIVQTTENTVVVCGGGEFANYVRKAQKKWHFNDVAAHEMAILAMQQTAVMCQNLQPKFVIAPSISEIKNHHFVIWSPNIADLNAAEIPATWNITSDSLAAWLATKLKADKLVVVKSCAIDSELTLIELREQCIVDSTFDEFVYDAKFNVTVISAKYFLNI